MAQLHRRSDRWVSALQSVLLHGALVGALVLGWWAFRRPPAPPPTVALDATVVSAKALNGMETSKAKPSPPPKVPAPPPKIAPAPAPPHVASSQPAADDQTVPVPSDLAAREADAKQQAEQAKAAAERKVQETAQRKKQAELEAEAQAERKAQEAKKVAQAQAAAQAAKRAAERKRLAAAAEARRKAEAKRKAREKLLAEQKRKAEEKLKAQAAQQAEAKALALNQSDLSASVAAEEKLMAARSGPAMASWEAQIKARIEHAWIRPPSAKPGIDCTIDVTQVPGGEIVNVKVGTCNGDQAVVQSIQDAAYRASPLPPPPDPTLFEGELQIEFKPN
jgi:colicin import membrane protein